MTARQPRKPGLYDTHIAKAKQLALVASYRASRESKAAVMVMTYGGRPSLQTDHVKALQARTVNPLECWNRAHSFTERGTFEHCAGRGV